MRKMGNQRLIQGLNGRWRYLGTIDATTTAKTNATATTPFTIPAGSLVMFQSTVTAHVSPGGSTSDATITAANSPRFDAYAPPVVVLLDADQDKIQTILPSGTGNVLVFGLG